MPISKRVTEAVDTQGIQDHVGALYKRWQRQPGQEIIQNTYQNIQKLAEVSPVSIQAAQEYLAHIWFQYQGSKRKEVSQQGRAYKTLPKSPIQKKRSVHGRAKKLHPR